MIDFKIGGIPIGTSHPPFVIAEMSGNHNQSLDRALEIVEAAAASGAHMLKLQTYTPDTMTLDITSGDFLIEEKDSLWSGRSLYELYAEASTPWEWHEPIIKRANELNMLCFSTPFDASAVDFLEQFDMPAYKIASFENADLPLIKKAASTGKPLIVSTGMASLGELEEAVKIMRGEGCTKFVLLKCTSTYPATADNSNICTIPHMRDLFQCEVGLSDHTMGVGSAVAAVALGATVIEKHFTLSRADGGVDAAFSLEPDELKSLVIETERAWRALGQVKYGPEQVELASMRFRRSIYISEDIAEGAELTSDNLRIVRPGFGLAPKYYDILLGRKVNKALRRGTAMKWEFLG